MHATDFLKLVLPHKMSVHFFKCISQRCFFYTRIVNWGLIDLLWIKIPRVFISNIFLFNERNAERIKETLSWIHRHLFSTMMVSRKCLYKNFLCYFLQLDLRKILLSFFKSKLKTRSSAYLKNCTVYFYLKIPQPKGSHKKFYITFFKWISLKLKFPP